jgi:hypothetical protein
MNKEQILKTCDLVKDYNDDLFKKLRLANKIIKGKSKTHKILQVDQIQEILILVSILLSANIKLRYELEDFVRDNKAFMDLSMIKSLTSNCKQDIDALKAASFSMVEVLKTMRSKEEEQKYKNEVL